MEINLNNYEIYFLDYWEKNLTPNQVAELMIFLEEHKELSDEFESFETIVIPSDENIKFDRKDLLKKHEIKSTSSINNKNYEEFFIAEIEGDLNKNQHKELNIFLKNNPFLIKDFDLYKKTKLIPDFNIQFDDKKSLKKHVRTGGKIRFLYIPSAIAASLLIVFGIFFLTKLNKTEQNLISQNIDNQKITSQLKNNIKNEVVNIKKIAKSKKIVNKSERTINKTENIEIIKPIDYKEIKIDNNNYASIYPEYLPEEKPVYTSVYAKLRFKEIYNDNPIALEKNKKTNPIKQFIAKKILNFTGTDSKTMDIADIGIKGLQKITDNKFQVTEEIKNDKTFKTYALGKFHFSKPVKEK